MLQVTYLVHLSPTWTEGDQSRPRQRPCSPTDFYFAESYLQHHTRFLVLRKGKTKQKTLLRLQVFLHQKDFCISLDNKRNQKDKTSKVKTQVAIQNKEKAYTLWLNHSNNTTSGLSFHQRVKETRRPRGCPCEHLCV